MIADEQTAGRGRFGKPWFSPWGVNLYMSVLLRPQIPPREAPGLSFVGPLALADGAAPLLAAWRDQDILTGRRVEVRGEGPSYVGRVLGVDHEGFLVLRDPLGERRRVLAGEIRLSD